MSRIPLVAGNWKMNGTVEEALYLIDRLLPGLREVENVDRLVCPPFTALAAVASRLSGSGIYVSAQNMYWEQSGAFTGEISPLMLKPYCRFVILGHSERRANFGETDETVNQRVFAALVHNLIPIICVGETLEEREGGRTEDVVQKQVRMALKDVDLASSDEIVIAYEPVWAIGTGKAATAEGANDVITQSIRAILGLEFGEDRAEATRILYGGSVKPSNAVEFFNQSDIDGALVGGASLKPQDFIEITRSA
jgi:triosephosphate isomerase